MSTLKFAETHNLVAFLEKPKESNGFKQIIDFLNASSIKYALTLNPTIYTSCIKKFWATTKNWKEWVLRQLPGMNSVALWPLLSSALPQTKYLTFPMFLDKQVEGMSKHKEIYVTPSHTKKIFANMKREGKGFFGRVTPLFQTMLVQVPEEVEHVTDEAINEEHVSTPSYDPPQSGEDRMQLNELMDLCAKLSDRVLALENKNTSQAAEIASLKERVKKLEKKRRSRTYKPKRLYKVGLSRRIESSNDASLGAQEDASKQGWKIVDFDTDIEVTLIDETQGRNYEDLMFDTGVLNGDEVFQEPMVNTATTTSSISVSVVDPVTTASEVVTTASVEVPEELTLAQTLIDIKISPSQLPQAKDKGKAKMVEPEKPLKKKDHIPIDEEVA
ncbi:hypothetical protein Tco_0163363 [Tanacetum coccineum]